MEEEFILQISQGEEDDAGQTETAEASADVVANSPLEEKVEEILTKLTSMETAITKMTGLFGGVFNGKSDE